MMLTSSNLKWRAFDTGTVAYHKYCTAGLTINKMDNALQSHALPTQ